MSDVILASEKFAKAIFGAAPEDIKGEKFKAVAERLKDEWRKHISPAGALALPELLDARRIQYGMPDQAFAGEAVFDRIFLWQIPHNFDETYTGTSIVKTPNARKREEEECPRGIIVSAGLRALDNLRSHGVDIGHIVQFLKVGPFRMPLGQIGGVDIPPLIVARDGDIAASEELPKLRRANKVRTIAVDAGGAVEHRLEVDGKTLSSPQMPWIPEDM